MRKNVPLYLLFGSMLAFSNLAVAQINWDDSLKAAGLTNRTVSPMVVTECPGWESHGYCNVVRNSQFINTGGSFNNPFSSNTNTILGWQNSHGTPQLDLFDAPNNNLPPNTHTASMWALNQAGEGIFGNIPAASPYGLNPGTPYLLSFYRRVNAEPTDPASRLDNITIALIKCGDRAGFQGSMNATIPAMPSGAQIIYCETNVDANMPGFQRIVVRFTPQSQYDLLWIFPRQQSSRGQAWLHIALPQIFRADLVQGPSYYDNNGNYYLGYNGGIDYMAGYTELCHEVNSQAEWFNASGTRVYNYTVLGSNYNFACPYTAPCPAKYGPVPVGSGQTYTFKQTFLQAVNTSNTCSDFVSSRISAPFQARVGVNTPLLQMTTENIITKDAAHIRFDAGKSDVVVRVESIGEQPITMIVYDLQGKVIRKYNGQAQKGSSTHTLHLPPVSAGMYLTNVQLGKNRYSHKFSVTK